MLNREFFQDVELTEQENSVLVWLCGWDEWMIDGIVSAFMKVRNQHKFDFVPIELDESNDTENLIKFTNYRSQIWVEGETDEENNILIINSKSISKIDSEPTRVDPFRTYEDLQKILNYFYDNKMYHHWLTACLMASLGRRVGDTISLKWSDLFLLNGEYRERLTTLKEEKTGKIAGVKLNALAKFYIEEYCKITDINPMEHYKERIFSNSDAAFRKMLK